MNKVEYNYLKPCVNYGQVAFVHVLQDMRLCSDLATSVTDCLIPDDSQTDQYENHFKY